MVDRALFGIGRLSRRVEQAIRGVLGHAHTHRLLAHMHQDLKDIMSTQARLAAVLASINTATSNIAADIRRLKDQIAAGAPTEETLAGLENAAQALDAVAAETPEDAEPPVDPPVEPTE